jgi:methylmalonyl-CoA mutase C-terminal domain/subunit
LTEKLMAQLAEKDLGELLVVVGGNVPARDVEGLEALGVARVFRTGSRFDDIVSFIEERVGG